MVRWDNGFLIPSRWVTISFFCLNSKTYQIDTRTAFLSSKRPDHPNNHSSNDIATFLLAYNPLQSLEEASDFPATILSSSLLAS